MTSNVPESAIDDLNAHTSSDDGPSPSQIADMAEFIEICLFAENGKLSKESVIAHDAFEERIKDVINDQRGCDEAFSSWIARSSLYYPDSDRMADALAELSREVILWVAEQHFDELADEARNLGWIE